jgi:hypothetical protein
MPHFSSQALSTIARGFIAQQGIRHGCALMANKGFLWAQQLIKPIL